jgi:predicted ATPase
MVTRIEALNYRCLRYVEQDLKPFQVLVGPNASGKTTFLDVIALMRDIVRDGVETAVNRRTPDFHDLFWQRQGKSFQLAIEAEIPPDRQTQLDSNGREICRFEIEVGETESQELGILAETLRLGPKRVPTVSQRTLFPMKRQAPESILMGRSRQGWKTVVNKVPGGNDNFYDETGGGWDHAFKLGVRKSALANLPDDETKFPVATWFKQFLLSGVERLVLNSEAMRQPCSPNVPHRFLPDGSNLPWAVYELGKNGENALLADWVAHVATALPDLTTVGTIERPHDRHRYLVLTYRNGLEVPSWLVSDGTLRMLALTLLAYLPQAQGVYLVEEPENGIHPAAVEIVFQSLSSVYEGQVLVASHSPVLVSQAELDQVLCFSMTPDGAVDVVLGSEHPKLSKWQHEVSLGTYLAGGVLG